MAANGSAVAVFVQPSERWHWRGPPSLDWIYSKTVGAAVEFTGRGQVVPANPVHIALVVSLLALVLFAVGAGLVLKMRGRGKADR